jgi:hypothetical protein
VNVHEKHRSALSSIFRAKYVPLLRSIRITDVTVDRQKVKVENLFGNDELGLTDLSTEELMGRRAIALRLIDDWLSNQTQNVDQFVIWEKRALALAAEEQLEQSFRTEKSKTDKAPKLFVTAVKSSSFDCALSCSGLSFYLILFENF